MGLDGKLSILMFVFSMMLCLWLIPSGIEQPGVEWKPGMGVLRNVALSARLFPNLLAMGIGITGILLFVSDLQRRRKRPNEPYDSGIRITKATLVAIGICVAYYFILRIGGFFYSTVPALVALLYCFGMRNWIKILITAIISPLFLHVVVEKIMLTELPKGILPMFF